MLDTDARSAVRKHPRFIDQREKIVQILIDWKQPYSTSRGSIPGEEAVAFIDRSAAASSGYPLNAEVEKRWEAHAAAESHRLVQRELDWMAEKRPHTYEPVKALFIRDEAGDGDYELLTHRAVQFEADVERVHELRAQIRDMKRVPVEVGLPIGTPFEELEVTEQRVANGAWAARLKLQLDIALDLLTVRLLDTELFALFGARPNRSRTEKTEARYRKCYREFVAACEALIFEGRKRYRSRAYDEAARQTGHARSTVEKAVHYFESDSYSCA